MNIIEKTTKEYRENGTAFCINTTKFLGIPFCKDIHTTQRSDILRSFEEIKQINKYKQIKGFN